MLVPGVDRLFKVGVGGGMVYILASTCISERAHDLPEKCTTNLEICLHATIARIEGDIDSEPAPCSHDNMN